MELTSVSSATNKLCSIASKSAPEVSAKLGTMFAAILLVCLATLNPLDFFFSSPFSTKVVADKRQKKPQQQKPKKKDTHPRGEANPSNKFLLHLRPPNPSTNKMGDERKEWKTY
jgi:hypothetical protein